MGVDMYVPLVAYLAARQKELDRIDSVRRARLEELIAYIRAQNAANRAARLVFVCTHNSRRSQFAQILAALAGEACGVSVATYSGGAEAMAFDSRAVAALERAGFRVERTTDDANPIYHVRFSDQRPALACFSKKFDGAPNPRDDCAAIMVCGEADAACPLAPGAAARFALPFVDPKVSDGTPQEAATYDERCAQIAREMLYVMSHCREKAVR